MPPEIGIAGERPVEHVDHDGRAEAVTGDDDLVDIGALGTSDHPLGKGLDPGLDIATPPQHVVAGKDPVGKPMVDPPALPRPAQQQDECEEGDSEPDGRADHGMIEHGGDGPSRGDREDGEQDHVEEGHEEKYRIAQIRREIAPDRA